MHRQIVGLVAKSRDSRNSGTFFKHCMSGFQVAKAQGRVFATFFISQAAFNDRWREPLDIAQR